MTGWTVERAGSAETFSALAGPLLSRHPVEANVPLSVLRLELDGRNPWGATDWLLVRDPDGDVAGAAMRTVGYPMFLPPLPDPAVDALAGWALAAMPDLAGVSGPVEHARRFAAAWQAGSGCTVVTRMAERMHALSAVRPPAGVPGRARPAVAGDARLCTRWLLAFGVEADVGRPPEQTRRAVPARIASGTLMLWETPGAGPVALAGWHHPVHGVGRVGPVYTPPERRNQGYGSAVTAAATQAVLDTGADRVMLYTDLANPVSNAIYARLGYVPVRDAALLGFEPAPDRPSPVRRSG